MSDAGTGSWPTAASVVVAGSNRKIALWWALPSVPPTSRIVPSRTVAVAWASGAGRCPATTAVPVLRSGAEDGPFRCGTGTLDLSPVETASVGLCRAARLVGGISRPPGSAPPGPSPWPRRRRLAALRRSAPAAPAQPRQTGRLVCSADPVSRVTTLDSARLDSSGSGGLAPCARPVVDSSRATPLAPYPFQGQSRRWPDARRSRP